MRPLKACTHYIPMRNYNPLIIVIKIKGVKDNYVNLEISENLTHDSSVAKSAI